MEDLRFLTAGQLYQLGVKSEGKDLEKICQVFAKRGFLLITEIKNLSILLQKLDVEALRKIADNWLQQADAVNHVVREEFERRNLILPA